MRCVRCSIDGAAGEWINRHQFHKMHNLHSSWCIKIHWRVYCTCRSTRREYPRHSCLGHEIIRCGFKRCALHWDFLHHHHLRSGSRIIHQQLIYPPPSSPATQCTLRLLSTCERFVWVWQRNCIASSWVFHAVVMVFDGSFQEQSSTVVANVF